jgi:transposase
LQRGDDPRGSSCGTRSSSPVFAASPARSRSMSSISGSISQSTGAAALAGSSHDLVARAGAMHARRQRASPHVRRRHRPRSCRRLGARSARADAAASVRVYLSTEAVDLRRGHDGLAALVHRQWGEALHEGHLFVLLGRRLDRCKILFSDRGGLVLYSERLERGRLWMPPVSADGTAVEMDATGLLMLLDGIDVARVRRPELWLPEVRVDA